MRKRVLPILLCLAIGAIVNVVVARCCLRASFVDRRGTGRPTLVEGAARPADGSALWNAFRLPGWPAAPTLAFRESQNPGSVQIAATAGAPRAMAGVREYRCGWPLQSLRHVVVIQVFPRRNDVHGLLRIETDLAPFPGMLPGFPWWPRPVAFIVNTLLYAGIVVAIVRLGRRLARRRRIARGLCTRCRYPVPEGTRCPECGHLDTAQTTHARHAGGPGG